MAYQLTTLNGYNMYDMASMYQKAIRRCDIPRAAFAANELFDKFNSYLWRRTLIISAEDCSGVITKEIEALYRAQEVVSGNKKEKERIFISKAIILLCHCMKNRDADYLVCNLMNDQLKPEIDKEPMDILTDSELEDLKIPDWVYDCHTLKGKKMGRTNAMMIETEQKALNPLQLGFFDDASWEYDIKKCGN